MFDVVKVTVLTSFAGLAGAGLGALLSFFIDRNNKRTVSFFLDFSAGIMLALVTFDLLPEAFKMSNVPTGLFGLIIGAGTVAFLENIFFYKKNKINKNIKFSNLKKSGFLIGIGMTLHNIPEGIAIGSAFDVNFKLALSIIIAITIHDIAEGLVMAIPLEASGISRAKTLFWTALSGLPTGLGAFIGAIIGKIYDPLISFSFAFAGGAMFYVIFSEIIPESKALYRGRFSTFGTLSGIILGLIITIYFH